MLTLKSLQSLVLALALSADQSAIAAEPAALLDPEKAFRLFAGALDERSVEIGFHIAEGYYMYRDRFRFESESGKAITGARLPAGKIKQDPFFGRTEIYRRQVRIRIPLSAEHTAKRRVKLKVTSQGCSDQGVCYIPQEQWVEVMLDAGASQRTP